MELKNLFNRFLRVVTFIGREENAWMWSLLAIMVLLFKAFVLLYLIFLSPNLF